MRFSIAEAGLRPTLVSFSTLVLVSIASCAKADPPEEFVADPSLQDDFTSNLPATGSSLGYKYAIIQGFAVYEGDILLGRVDGNGLLTTRFQARGVGKNDAFNRWPDGIVIYEKPVNNSAVQQENVEKAIAHWTEHTTLTFVERTAENAAQHPHYIKFLDTQSCASHVGMIGGEQPIYISDACSTGSVIHEIGHAVGLFHEHTRPDRDNFVQIDWNEVISDKEINFERQTANVANYSSYDFGSIMHYGESFFSKSGRPTIVVPDGVEIGQREALSALDIQSVNNMYETDLALGPTAVQQTDDGLKLDITTYNYGNLGAHNVELYLRLADDSQWLAVSNDSGWECLVYGPELKCLRDSFRELTESRFTVLADAGQATVDDLSARLLSRTQDSDESNNFLNEDDVEWQSLELDNTASDSLDENSEQDAVADTNANTDSGSSPTPAAATPRQTNQHTESMEPLVLPAGLNAGQSGSDEPLVSAANQTGKTYQVTVPDAAAGGSVQLSMLALLATMVGIRRRRKL